MTGYYPSYAFYRLAWLVGRPLPCVGKLLALAGKLTDRVAGPGLTRAFGFELVVSGVKPPGGPT